MVVEAEVDAAFILLEFCLDCSILMCTDLKRNDANPIYIY